MSDFSDAMRRAALQKLAAVGLPGQVNQTTAQPVTPPPAPAQRSRPTIGAYDPRTATLARTMRFHPESPWPVRQIGRAMDNAPAQRALGAAGNAVAAAASPVAKAWDAASAAGSKYVGTPLRSALYRTQGVKPASIPSRISSAADAKNWQNATAGARLKLPDYLGGGKMRVSPYDVAFLFAPGGTAMKGTRLSKALSARRATSGRASGNLISDISASTYAGNVRGAAERIGLSASEAANAGQRYRSSSQSPWGSSAPRQLSKQPMAPIRPNLAGVL